MEGQTIVKEIMNALKLHTEHIDRRLDGLEDRIGRIESRIDNIEGRLDSLESRIDNIEGRLDNLENRIDNIESRLDSLEQKVDKGFTNLDIKFSGSRVELNETQETVDFLSSKVTQHESKIRGLQSQT